MKIGQRLKIRMGAETKSERKKRVAREKKENEKAFKYFLELSNKSKKEEKKISTIEFKNLFWEEGKEYFNKMNREFVIDESNKTFLNLISLYFSNNPQFENDYDGELRKGLLVYGICGTGKSSVFDIIQNISRKNNLMNLWFKNISVHDVITDYNINGEDVVKKCTRGRIHFDDLGTEKLANSWGVREVLMGRILEIRYNEFKAKGTKTFVTTNLSIRELEKVYGKRIYDRLFDMFNFIELGGKTRRC